MKKIMHSLLALTVTLTLSGCYGPFQLTKKLHKWNGEVGNKWANEAVFLGLALLPVYSFAALGDAIIFNSIEFWGGKNPVTAKKIQRVQEGDKEAVLSFAPETQKLRVDSFEKGRPASTIVIEPDANGNMIARNGRGELLLSATTQDGEVILTNAAGRKVAPPPSLTGR